MRYPMNTLNVLIIAGCALWTGLATAAEPSVPAEGRSAKTRDARPPTDDISTRRAAAYGRAVIYRAGEMPRPQPLEQATEKPPARKSSRPTHYLNTTLPVIIQGAPQRMALERHFATG
ncbi:MAG TPA: hypothetical protein VFI31_04925 [Pirellulales bacterium]|nr:hypothetical protein [Pirellulales bacterium]